MLPAITLERITSTLDAMKLNYDVDDQEVYFGFPGLSNRVFFDERLFTVESFWRGKIVSPEDTQTALEVCEFINAGSTFPKAYLRRPEGAENTLIFFEYQMPTHSTGVTPEQLNAYLDSAIGWGLAASHKAATELPHLVTWEEE